MQLNPEFAVWILGVIGSGIFGFLSITVHLLVRINASVTELKTGRAVDVVQLDTLKQRVATLERFHERATA